MGLPAPSAEGRASVRLSPAVVRIAWVASTAVNNDTIVPIPSVNANPCTSWVESTNRMNAVMIVTTFASMIADRPFLYPVAIPARTDLPARISSLTRSKITMFASAATPIVRIRPAIPASVSTIGISLIIA